MKFPRGLWELKGALGAEDVWLDTADGVRIHAWWVVAPNSDLVTLYLHGNAGNITHRGMQIRSITTAGSSVLMLDYRGYGKSAGRPTEKGLYEDAGAAYQYLLGRRHQPQRILLHGESLGTAVAVDLAARRPCAGLILEAPFTSGGDIAQSVLPILGPLLFRGFDSRAKIGSVHAPILIIHGDRDDIIPFRLGRALFDAAPEPKSFWQVEGAGHNDLVEAAGERYPERLRNFYQRL